MIGHRDEPVSDKDVSDGEVSHLVTKLEIVDKGDGYGEALILGTKAGENLYKYFKAKSKLRPSSRAWGIWGEDEEGGMYPEEEDFFFDTFDFVRFPGIKETEVQMFEEKQEKSTNKHKKEGFNMDPKELLKIQERLMNDNSKLRAKVDSISETFRSTKSKALKISEAYKSKSTKHSKISESLHRFYSDITGKVFEDIKVMSNEEIVRELSKLFKVIKDIGGPEKITEALTKANTSLTAFRKTVGSTKNAKNIMEEYKEYSGIGKPLEIKRAIREARKTIDAYLKVGNLQSVTESVKYAKNIKGKVDALGKKKIAEELSKSLNMTIEKATPIVERLGITEAAKLVAESKIAASAKPKGGKTPAPINEEKEYGLAVGGAGRFFEGLN